MAGIAMKRLITSCLVLVILTASGTSLPPILDNGDVLDSNTCDLLGNLFDDLF
jgi:hypothetical protein